MHDPLRNPASNVLTRAQREIQIMSLLHDSPMTIREIAEEIDINPRTVKSIIQDLTQDKLTYRKRGTRKIFLDPGDFTWAGA